MFLLAAWHKLAPKWFTLPKIVFVQAGLGSSSSWPRDDSLCWRWGRVEGVGIGWKVVFPCSYLVLLQPVQCFRGNRSLKSQGVKLRTKLVSTQTTQSSPLPLLSPSSPPPLLSPCSPLSQCQVQTAAYENLPLRVRLLKAHSWKRDSQVWWTGKKTKTFNTCLCTLSKGRKPYLSVIKEVLTRPQIIPAKPVQIKVCTAQSCQKKRLMESLIQSGVSAPWEPSASLN